MWVLIRKSEWIQLTADAHFWQTQHGRAVRKIATLEEALALAKAEIKDLQKTALAGAEQRGIKQVARNLLSAGVPPETIMQTTGLSRVEPDSLI